MVWVTALNIPLLGVIGMLLDCSVLYVLLHPTLGEGNFTRSSILLVLLCVVAWNGALLPITTVQ